MQILAYLQVKTNYEHANKIALTVESNYGHANKIAFTGENRIKLKIFQAREGAWFLSPITLSSSFCL